MNLMKLSTRDERIATARKIAKATGGIVDADSKSGNIHVCLGDQYIDVCHDGINITEATSDGVFCATVKALCKQNLTPCYEVLYQINDGEKRRFKLSEM